MKNIAIITLAILFLSACSVSNPKVSLGKKCVVKDDSVSYSYVWIYDKTLASKPSAEQCEQLKD